MTLRKFGSRIEGHPTMAFPYTEVPTGSLGQGLSVGVGMALHGKYVAKLPYKTYVLLGDSEMAEGSVWEAIQIAAHYKLDNLIGIIDVNRLGQRGETMYGHDIESYQRKLAAFDWETIVIDGHNYQEIMDAYKKAASTTGKPTMIIARTLKGKGISFIEDKENWHGKPLTEEDLQKALAELGEVDTKIRGSIASPLQGETQNSNVKTQNQNEKLKTEYNVGDMVATRKAYGNALAKLAKVNPRIVVLDAETSNSTYAEFVKKENPEKFFEMYIAEQNMAGSALGFARRGDIPFASTFAAFFTRAFDQIRMAGLSLQHLVFVGSHAGVSIGEDGASQMGLEDLAMFRTIWGSTVLYPSDAISTERLVEEAANAKGVVYIRTTRKETPVLYDSSEEFPVGGSKVHKLKNQNSHVKTITKNSKIVIIGAGVTLHEALGAQQALANEGYDVVVIDCYSVKPLDRGTIVNESKDAKAVIVVEDHYSEGGIGEAVSQVLTGTDVPVVSLAVTKMPKSGKPQELLDYEGISSKAIIEKIKEI